MKNDRLWVSALHPLVLCCLWRRHVWPWEEMTVFEPTVMGTVSELPVARVKELSSEVKGFSSALPPSFLLAAPFLTFIFLSASVFQALPFKSLFTQFPGRLLCRTEEQGWVLGWTDEGALIGRWWLWHVPPYGSITLPRPLPNSHLSCQSLTWEQNVNPKNMHWCCRNYLVSFLGLTPLCLGQIQPLLWVVS